MGHLSTGRPGYSLLDLIDVVVVVVIEAVVVIEVLGRGNGGRGSGHEQEPLQVSIAVLLHPVGLEQWQMHPTNLDRRVTTMDRAVVRIFERRLFPTSSTNPRVYVVFLRRMGAS